jgi:iron(III) transport system ATP-binding protein
VGSPREVYRHPPDAFVAPFVGRINALRGTLAASNQVHFGGMPFECVHRGEAGREATSCLRPEEVLAQPIAAGDANMLEARNDKIEFPGSYCLVEVGAEASRRRPLSVTLSLNFLTERQPEVGATLPLRLLPEHMHIF